MISIQKKCVFDIDGVLNYYPNTWIEFANERAQRNCKTLDELKNGLSYITYKRIKEEYRECGIKETFKVRENALELLTLLKEKDFYILVVTARPISKCNSLMAQTTNWLKKNNLPYDNIFFSEKKHLSILEYFNDIEFVVEDNRAYANDIAKHNYKVFLLDNDYNQGDINHLVRRITNLNQIIGVYKDANK